ncbi:hypothetical protein DSO57_1025161 [Entomophthora muscae]|uniref:Uncharacterized protein n=1 Tax=Entomophthora muscae TaxID=34485 RepID=A0ACC2T2H9_9FUNG|nr:hypothetical protein DSO57_1025161 [Entomophthora muscae]
MYPVCGDEDSLVTLIPEFQVASTPSCIQFQLPLPLLRLLSSAPWRPLQEILLALLGTLLHDMLLA